MRPSISAQVSILVTQEAADHQIIITSDEKVLTAWIQDSQGQWTEADQVKWTELLGVTKDPVALHFWAKAWAKRIASEGE